MAKKALKILSIEDSRADFLLIERHLRQQGLQAECSRVDSLDGLSQILIGCTWDLVLSDYNVPGLEFLSSFSYIQSQCPELPIILVSGSIGEEHAVELLKLGVVDFILKDNLTRLVPAIERSQRELLDKQARKAAEESMRESEYRFRSIFNNSPIAIGIGRRNDGTLVEVNDAWLELFGFSREEVIGKTTEGLNQYVNAEDRKELIKNINEYGHIVNRVLQLRRKNGDLMFVQYSAEIIKLGEELFLQAMLTDITERRNLEAQLRQAQKMEDIGTLAGGIAHDFNNILTGIVGYSTLLQMDAQLDEKGREYVDNLMGLSERAAHLTRGLLAFSRKQVMSPRRINLNDIISTIIKLISRLIGENITIETHLSPSPLLIMADCGQIEQVLMNLATNARDAMPSGGRLTIATDTVCLEPDNPLLGTSNQPGLHARILVSDTGCGMDEATMGRIFEPFFTTKGPDKGTGLGLSILYGIIKQHQGYIQVSSNPGSGTTFTISFPLVEQTKEVVNENYSTPQPGVETIMIAEDEPSIRLVLRHILQQSGYRILEASDGEEAVRVLSENVSDISLVLLDMIMPRMNGKEALHAMRQIAPDIKTLFMSGYPSDVITQKDLMPEGVSYLQKPVSPMELLTSIRSILDS
ncbi:MAG: response regulator [Desulfuromonadales bacterium]|nr:response regulator [Desulfuromonadales bacterium]